MKLAKALLIFLPTILFYVENTNGQSFMSNYYFIGDVFDNRIEKSTAIGQIYKELTIIPIPFLLEKGPVNFLKKGLNTEFKNKRDPYFIHLNLQKLKFSENLDEKNIVNGKFEFNGSFFLKTGDDSIPIYPFKYSVKYRRQAYDHEKLVGLINTRLRDLNNNLEKWFKANYQKNTQLARHVIVNTIDYFPKNNDPDTLYFTERKLVMDDFTLINKAPNKYAASIFTSMGYEATERMGNDTVYLDLKVKVYQIKTMSWILEESKTKFVLAHEQTHFDITQFVAEKFKQRLRDEAITPTDYDSRIQFLYIDYYRMIHKMQSQYDDETAHGLNKIEQARWEQNIKNELENFSKTNKN